MAESPRHWSSAPAAGRVEARLRACAVNDDGAVLGSLKFLLEAAGFDVRVFASGRRLLSSPSLRTAHCFFLDHRPRGADGLHLARRLRKIGVRAPIVVTTGFRCGALEAMAAAVDLVFPAPQVDEQLIEHLVRIAREQAAPASV